MNEHSTESDFDPYASNYEIALQKGLSVSGDSADYFALARIRWLRMQLGRLPGQFLSVDNAMDFGCGTGNSVSHLLCELNVKHVVGIDTSEQSLVQARERYTESEATFMTAEAYTPSSSMDLVFCNGVFHHIPVAKRAEAADFVYRCLKPNGLFAFWENNPWNPGTRIVMSRIPFDRDAITLSIRESKRLLKQAGFENIQVDTCFYFPRFLRWFRPLETLLSRFPFGAQYLVLVKKPS